MSYYWKSLYFQRNVLRIRTQEEQLNTSVIHLRVYVLLWINNVKPNSQDWYELFFFLRNIAKIRKFLSYRQCEVLIHAFISSKLDYCNALLSGLQKSQVKRLQYVQNSAARLLTSTGRYEHVTPVLRSLHWLPVSARIDFKILLLVFKVLNGLGPLYLCELLEPYIPNRNLRSSGKKLLIVPKCNLKTYGYRAFSHRAPTLWNALPDDIRQVDHIQTFKSKLKTHLFRQL